MKKTRASALPLCLLAAVSAGVVFVLVLVFGGFAPFGSNLLMRYDALHQYVPMLSEFAERLRGGASLLYSFRNGGANFYATALYYLINPFNLLALLFPVERTYDAFTMIIGVSTAATAASAAWYLQDRFQKRTVSCVTFALIYTFCGFYLAYYYNTMWLMALVLLPLIARGIEKVANGGKPWLYLFSLAFAIICSFYMGYMLCIFSVLYFFVCLFSRNVNKKGEDDVQLFPVLLKFGASSLAAGGLSAITLMPIFFALSNAFSKNIFSDDVLLFFNPLDFFTAHLPGVVYNTIAMTNETLPAVSLGALALVLLPMYAFIKSVSKNEKIAHILLVFVFWVSFEIPPIYYLWHGMSAPAGLPYRFSYIYAFVLLSMAYQVFIHLSEISKKWLALSAILLTGVFVYNFCTRTGAHLLDVQYVLVSVAFLLVVLLRFLTKPRAQSVLRVCALFLVAAECVTIAHIQFSGISKEEYMIYRNDVDSAKALIAETDTDFYRMEFSDSVGVTVSGSENHAGMAGSMYGFYGITNFSSLADQYYSFLQFDMGNEGNLANTYAYAQQTPMYNTLFGIDYILDTKGNLQNSPYYTAVGQTEQLTVYQVDDGIGFGILANPTVAEWDGYNNNSLAAQSSLWQAATGVSNVLDFLPIESIQLHNCEMTSLPDAQVSTEETEAHEDEDGHTHLSEEMINAILSGTDGYYPYKITGNAYSMTFTIVPQQTQNLFIMSQSGVLDTIQVTSRTGEQTHRFSEKKLTDLGLCEAGVPIEITVSSSNASAYDTNGNSETGVDDSLYFLVAAVNDEAYQAGLQTLQENGTFQMTEFSETEIKGTVTAAKDCVMTVAMPYDAGWTVTIDGEETELIEHSSHWMMFSMPAGEHEIEMHYFPQGLKEGLFVSAATLLMIFLSILLTKMRAARFAAEEAEEQRANAAAEQNPSAESAAPARETTEENPPKATE